MFCARRPPRIIVLGCLIWLLCCLLLLTTRLSAQEQPVRAQMLIWALRGEVFTLYRYDPERRLFAQVVKTPPFRMISPPQLAADGQRVIFEADRDGERAVLLVDARGRQLFESSRRVATRLPSWSPQGDRIVFWSTDDGFWNFNVMSNIGSGERPVTSLTGLVPYSYPLWSPDGRRILFRVWIAEQGSSIFLADVDTGETRPLTSQLSATGDLVWSPDSRHLAFRSERQRNGEIHVLDVESGEQANLTQHQATDFQPDWSPDGRQIVFVSNRQGSGELYIMNADGSSPRQITSGGAWSPDWSPDGEQIAFVSRRDGRDALYLINADGSDLRYVMALSQQTIFLGWFMPPK